MPNHITNKFTPVGKEEAVLEFLKQVSTDDRAIDFNKIVEMPESLQVEDSSLGDLGLFHLYGMKRHGYYPLSDGELFRRFEELSEEMKIEADKIGKAYKSNMEEHGYRTWYDWANDNWGTKWNAYSTRVEDDSIYFDTAWSGVPDLICKLSLKFPDLGFEYSWADEDTGSNTGRMKIYNGEIVEDTSPENSSKEAYELAFELTDAKKYYAWNEEAGQYEYVEDEE